MRTTSHLAAFVALGLSIGGIVACGGKIAGDGRSSSGSDPNGNGAASSGSGGPGTGSGGISFPPPSSSDQPSSPFAPFTPPPSSSAGLGQPSGGSPVDDACAAICERNGKCGTAPPDCTASCTSEIDSAVACGAQANAYIQCYASNLQSGCGELPPVCESEYCDYTICTGKVVPGYCYPR